MVGNSIKITNKRAVCRIQFSKPVKSVQAKAGDIVAECSAGSLPSKEWTITLNGVKIDKATSFAISVLADGTLVNALLYHCGESLSGIGGVSRPGIVHRLDQDTSGVMVVAKSQRAMDVLTREFASHANVEKTYLALVHGTPVPAEGRVENLIGRSPFDRKKMAIVDRNGKVAVPNYRVVASARAVSRVECVIETGRTHQIRVHMASLGTPVVGDAVYGRPRLDRQLDPPPARQLLHAWRLALKHPVTRDPMVFEAPPPADFAAPWAPPA